MVTALLAGVASGIAVTLHVALDLLVTAATAVLAATLQVGVNPPWWWCCPPVAATLLAAHGQAGPVPLLRVNGLPSWQGRTPLTVALPSHNPPGRGRQTTPVAAPLPEIPASLQILIPPPPPIMELAED